MQAKLKEFLDETREPLPPISGPDEPLSIDSLAFIRVVAFIQNDLGILLEDEELHTDNFATFGAICKILESRKQGEIGSTSN